jgi:uncharacterized protein (TIGR02466 family)
MTIQDIFKIPIYEVKLDLDIKEIQSFCKKHKIEGKSRVLSNVGGYQSHDLSLKDVTLQPLIKEIETHSTKFANAFINERCQGIKNMWININSYKDTNMAHRHAGCDLSGVYYVKAPSDCGNIVFEHPAYDLLQYHNILANVRVWEPEKWSAYNLGRAGKPAVENTLYLFPGWLKHSVNPSQNKTEERISISFNTGQMIKENKIDHIVAQMFVPRKMD